MTEGLLFWAAEKILLPIANSSIGKAGRAAPRWLSRLHSFVRIKRLELEVTDGELQILSLISGRQYDYQYIEKMLAGSLEGEDLLLAVTKLQVLGLLSAPRRQQPPHPDALFNAAGDANALLQAKTVKPTRARPCRREIPEAMRRRKRAAANAQWLTEHEHLKRNADSLPADLVNEAEMRRRELSEDQLWLAEHGL
jgi:hypothetical protein